MRGNIEQRTANTEPRTQSARSIFSVRRIVSGVVPGHRILPALLALVVMAFSASGQSAAMTNVSVVARHPLMLGEVLTSITNQYPPLLAALIERDVAAGRLKSAQGTFDFNTFARLFGNPSGFYESTTFDVGFEQFLGVWGSTIFGGYRVNWGDLLPDYDKRRTDAGGEPRIGLRVPLLRDGSIDRRRAAVLKAKLDTELANPVIARQQLDFIRAGTVAYVNWLAAGERWRLAEELLRIANDRNEAITNQVAAGLVGKIVLTDNQRLVVSREIGIVQARRRFEAAALALSLFYRNTADEPVIAGRERLPGKFPTTSAPDAERLVSDLDLAALNRPELRQIRLTIDKLEVDRRLARNQMLPNLDAGAVASQNLGEQRYKDLGQFELDLGVEFRMPLQRRDARGRLAELDGQIEQVTNQERFARDRISTEVRDAFSALLAAYQQIQQAQLNVALAEELRAAEAEKFRVGGSDLLALQLREQAAFDSHLQEVDALTEYFRALADYRAATAVDLAARTSTTAPAPAASPAR